MKKLFITLVSLYTLAHAAGSCTLAPYGEFEVTWEAYKTPAKAGVGGSFKSVEYTLAAPEGKNFKTIFLGSKVSIDMKSVHTNDAARDERLVKYFFNMMGGEKIIGTIVDVKGGKREKGKPKTGIMTLELTMNGVTKNVPMKYSYFDGKLDVNGVIDVLDFNALGALTSINKACFDLHEGKTWNDVAIGFSTKIKALLCSQ